MDDLDPPAGPRGGRVPPWAEAPPAAADLYVFDVDGTLIHSFLRDGAPREEYDRVELLPGRKAMLDLLPGRKALATNQGGVAMGYQTEDEVRDKMRLVARELDRVPCLFTGVGGIPTRAGADLLTIHVAMHHPEAKLLDWAAPIPLDMTNPRDVCWRRKPGPGLLLEAMDVHGITDPQRVLFVGDRPEDVEAAQRAGVRFAHADDFFASAEKLALADQEACTGLTRQAKR